QQLAAIEVLGFVEPVAIAALKKRADKKVWYVVQAADEVHSEREFTAVGGFFFDGLKMRCEFLFLPIAFIDRDVGAAQKTIIFLGGQGVAFVKTGVGLILAIVDAQVFAQRA